MSANLINEFQPLDYADQFLLDVLTKLAPQPLHPWRLALAVVERLFFSWQIQVLQFPTHHARTGGHAAVFLDTGTQLVQRRIGASLDLRPNEIITGPQRALGAAGVWPGRTTTGIPLAIPPLFHRGFVDTEPRGDGGLRLSRFQSGDDTFA